MSTFTEFPFATLAQLKSRLSVRTTDFDSAFADALRFSAAAIERAAGRKLRRVPGRVERFTGGGSLINFAVYPVAKVHYIRESLTRNFTDPDEYTELVQDVDYALDPDTNGSRIGESGIVRRLDATWLGSRQQPSMIEARYTGGYKTDDEEALENSTVAFTSSQEIRDFVVNAFGVDPLATIANDTDAIVSINEILIPGDPTNRLCVTIDTSNFLSPIWSVQTFQLLIKAANSGAGSSTVQVYVLPVNASKSSAQTIYDSLASAVLVQSFVVTGVSYATRTIDFSGSPSTFPPAIESTIADGHISLLFKLSSGSDAPVNFKTIESSDATDKPSATVKHYTSIMDTFTMEDDLRVANLIQASHDHYTRANPGALFEAQRGVAIASGSTVQKKEAGLLPYVLDVARSYRRLF